MIQRNFVIKPIEIIRKIRDSMTNGNMFFVFVLTLTFAVNINGQGQLISLPTIRIELFLAGK